MRTEIEAECLEVMKVLVEKNAKYGDAALSPVRVFSKASAIEQILVRIDDKISRAKKGHPGEDEDVVLDLIGYLILLRIARKRLMSYIPKMEDDDWTTTHPTLGRVR
jgi:hypothetical protein